MARAFILEKPRSLSPIVLTCEHATRDLPFRVRLDPSQQRILDSHWGWDIGAWELTLDVAQRLDAGAIGGRWSRLLIDLNRRVDDPTLVRREAESVTLPWNAGVTPREVERRLLTYHAPYHQELDRLILRRVVRGIRPLIFSVHSFTPVYDGRTRRFQIGVLYEYHRGPAHRLGRSLRDAGLSVRYNQPYSGMAGMMYAVDRHGSHHRLPCLELEVNHSMIERSTAIRRLGGIVARGIESMLPSLKG